MKSTLESLSTLERKLNIEVSASEVQAAFDQAYKGIQRVASIKGFRKGKAPLTTVKSTFRDKVEKDVIEDLIQTHYVDALREHSLNPISYPVIEFDGLKDEQNFQFTAEFEVRPEVTLKNIENLSVTKERLKIPEDLIEKTLENIRSSHAETAPVLEDRPAQNEDVAVIDFQGFVDGAELENGSSTDHEIALGGGTFIPGFEEGIVGKKPGDSFTLSLSFPEDYGAEDLAGKPVEFRVTLKSLKKRVLPEANDELATRVGPFENLESLKDAIRQDFTERESGRIAGELKDRLLRALVSQNPVDVPKSMLQEQKESLIESFKQRMGRQGIDDSKFEEYRQKWDEDFEKTAVFMVQSGFLINQIAFDQKFKVTPAEFDAEISEYAQQTGLRLDRLREFYEDRDRRSNLDYRITEKKVIDYLLSKVQVIEADREELEQETPQG